MTKGKTTRNTWNTKCSRMERYKT